jgi:hypothetical protein
MRFRGRFMREVSRFERCCGGADCTQAGLAQFHDYESRGIRPATPDPYFARLLDGKRWWEWQVNEIARMYGTDEWWGWHQLAEDFANDKPALKQIADRIGVAITL